MRSFEKLAIIVCCALALPVFAQNDEDIEAGPACADFQLTLTSGRRQEAAGPLFYSQQIESQTQWALPPFYCRTVTPDVDWSEWEFLYPLIDYRRFGREYKLQILELLSFSGGQDTPENGVKKLTLFPFYFQQRAPDTNLNFTAVVPFYGELKNRLFRDDIKFIMFPLYSETRKKDVVTDNYLYPIFDLRHGNQLHGWQFWPVVGVEHKLPTYRTNTLDEVEVIGGYDKMFAVFPFFAEGRAGLGTTNEQSTLTIIPFYNRLRSTLRDETSYGWPFGYNDIDDRGKGYVEHDFLWPLFIKARGSKYVTRIFPAYSHATNAALESDFWMWPVYKFNQLKSPPLLRQRTRVLFFVYSDVVETNNDSHATFRRTDYWPFYQYRHEIDGNERWQALALFEPLFPNNRAILREYSQVWSFWRCEKNPKTHKSSQSLFWNLYRHETTATSKNFSLCFGLIKYESGAEGRHWRVFYLPVGKKAAQTVAPKS